MADLFYTVIGIAFVGYLVYRWLTKGERTSVDNDEGITDEELLTYSAISGNKRAEKFFLWRIWTRR